jgi:hypothetical protein
MKTMVIILGSQNNSFPFFFVICFIDFFMYLVSNMKI